MTAESISDAISVLVVDDQPVVRAGLQMMLDEEPDITVAASAVDGMDGVRLAREHRPDVVLMDIRMPNLDGVEATRRILSEATAGAIVMITTFDDEEYLLESVRVGASGFLLKDAGPDLLAAAIRAAHRGDSLIDPAMTRDLLQRRLDESGSTALNAADERRTAMLDTLSAREREVLMALARGWNNLEIASQFFVSEATVKTHVSRVLLKTESRSRVQAAVFAYESGFVRPGWLIPPAAPRTDI